MSEKNFPPKGMSNTPTSSYMGIKNSSSRMEVIFRVPTSLIFFFFWKGTLFTGALFKCVGKNWGYCEVRRGYFCYFEQQILRGRKAISVIWHFWPSTSHSGCIWL